MHTNSIEAYKALLNSGTLNDQERKVLAYVHDNQGLTREEIARGMNMKITTLIGRVADLKAKGALHDKGRKNGKSMVYFGGVEMDHGKELHKFELLMNRLMKMIAKFPELRDLALKELA